MRYLDTSIMLIQNISFLLSVILTGLLAQPDYVEQTYGAGVRAGGYGLFYGGGGSLLLCQFIGICSILAWVTAILGPVFFLLKKFNLIRVAPEVEISGLDVSKHGGTAYSHLHEGNCEWSRQDSSFMDTELQSQATKLVQVYPISTDGALAAEGDSMSTSARKIAFA